MANDPVRPASNEVAPARRPATPEPPAQPTLDQVSKWFIERPRRGAASVVRIGNDVTPYIHVLDYYKAAATAIEATSGSDGYVVMAGWALDLDLVIPRGSSTVKLRDLLSSAGARGVQVRVLLSGHLTHPNGAAVAWISSQKGCFAYADSRLRFFGSFHQKSLVTSSPDGPVAFLGGMDFDTARLQSPTDPMKGPWHDIQVRITGGVANDVLDTLALRWKTAVDRSYNPLPKLTLPVGQRVAGSKKRACQVVRTYGNPTTGLTLEALTSQSTLNDISLAWRRFQRTLHDPVFGFAPQGESGIHDLLVKAIRVAETSIYVEDQYFVLAAAIGGTNELLQALATTVAKSTFKHLVVITCDVGTIQGELYQVNKRRRDLWNSVAARYPGKVSVWAYKGGQNRCYWMHTKAWIFDDTFAVIGSANFNRRSLTTDGELAVGVVDLEPTGASNWVKDLRISLWQKHLDAPKRPVSREQVADFDVGRKLWVDDSPGDTSRSFVLPLDLAAGNPWHPDKLFLCSDTPTGWVAKLGKTAACRIAPALGAPLNTFDGQWDFIDPDGS